MKPNHPRGTRVACYLRKSTDDQEESIDVQRDAATQYADQRGWVIVEEFVDSGVSRAEFKRRPGLIAALNAARERRFDVLLLRDETRLGGDQFRTGLILQDLADNHVAVVYHFTDELVSVDGAVDKFLVAARNFAAELEREKISQRTHEHLARKAKQGRPAGGISYGYRIVDGAYVVDPEQAAVVRRIFERYAAGDGQRTIAVQLNAEGVPSPTAGRRGTGSWAPSAIRAMLTNPRYVGRGRYNQTRKLYRGGTKVRERRAQSEHFEYATPAIIDQHLWEQVETRFAANQRFGVTRATKGAARRYLLTGHVRCAACGGPVTVANRRHGRENRRVYVCGWRRDRGAAVCANSVSPEVERLDAAVIAGVRALLTPEIIEEVMRELRAILQERLRAAPGEQRQLATEAAQLRREIQRLTTALASTDDPPSSVVQMISQKERRLRQVEAQLATHDTALSTVSRELDQMEQEARTRLADLDREFRESPEHARDIIARLTRREKLKLSRSGERAVVEGPIAVPEVVLSGTAPTPDCVASPAGFEPASPT